MRFRREDACINNAPSNLFSDQRFARQYGSLLNIYEANLWQLQMVRLIFNYIEPFLLDLSFLVDCNLSTTIIGHRGNHDIRREGASKSPSKACYSQQKSILNLCGVISIISSSCC
ncbi:hypothetical protein FGO68_gene3968 [Halteria grandinella]|uniref:Uncharacterized protein n=1 Tax=Halteria grandinella TaxID=5974 RepID=A0A8J8T9U1_HALGN|nr:hypothetical protein FGO68_gene3968 [Halteria grandinella]